MKQVELTSMRGAVREWRSDVVPRTTLDRVTRARRTVRRRTATAAAAYAIAAMAGGAVAIAMRGAGPVVWWTAAGSAALLLVEFLTIPHNSRGRATRPVRRLALLGGSFLLLGTVADRLTPAQVQAGFLVAATVGVTALVSVGLHRLASGARQTLVVGDPTGVGHLIRQWAGVDDVEIVGICLAQVPDDLQDAVSEIDGFPVVGDLSTAAESAVELGVDDVVVAPGPLLSARDVRRLSWALEATDVELNVAAEVSGVVPHRVQPRLMGKRLLLSVNPSSQPRLVRQVKATIDYVGAAVLLVVLSPLMILVAGVVRAESPGPALFRQRRAGCDGRPFTMYKFRTMEAGAEERLDEILDRNEAFGPLFKLKDDPRITRIGTFLRKSSLDELPQLFNVLKGEMSLIGPRPYLVEQSENYDDWIRRRLRVKPGMTGAWQVSGRSNLPWDESVSLDLDYVDNQTISGDMVIAAKTLRAVFRRDGC